MKGSKLMAVLAVLAVILTFLLYTVWYTIPFDVAILALTSIFVISFWKEFLS